VKHRLDLKFSSAFFSRLLPLIEIRRLTRLYQLFLFMKKMDPYPSQDKANNWSFCPIFIYTQKYKPKNRGRRTEVPHLTTIGMKLMKARFRLQQLVSCCCFPLSFVRPVSRMRGARMEPACLAIGTWSHVLSVSFGRWVRWSSFIHYRFSHVFGGSGRADER
jgi:hypothetical protein